MVKNEKLLYYIYNNQQILELEQNNKLAKYFENKNIIDFLTNHIQLDYLLQNLQTQTPLLDKLNSIEKSTENDTIKELLDIIKIQIKSSIIKEHTNFIKELNYSLDTKHPRKCIPITKKL